MSDTSSLLAVLAAIQKNNKASYAPSSLPKYHISKKQHVPAYTHSGVVNPKTSKGSTEDGGKEHHRFGILGALASDIEDTVTGIPGGIIQTAHHPVATVKAIGADYKRRYSPLVSGDFGKFFSEVKAHPLAPLLDVASVATGGGALAAKVGQSAKVAEVVDSARAASAAKVADKLAVETAPARKTVETLTKKAEKVKVDQGMAKARVEAAKHPDVHKASVKAFDMHTKTIATIQAEIAKASKGIAEATKNSTATPAELSGLPKMLARLQDTTSGGTIRIGASRHAPVKAIEVAYSHNPVKALRTKLGVKVQEYVIPTRTPLIGLESRAKKAANLQRQGLAARTRAPQVAVEEAIAHMTKVGKGEKTPLSGAMAVAAQGLIDGVSPADYARLVKDTRSATAARLIEKVGKDVFHAETAKLVAPHLDKRAQEIYEGARQYAQREAMEAGKDIFPIYRQHGFKSKWIDSPEVAAVVKLQKAHEKAATSAMEQLIKAHLLKPDVASQQAVLHINLVRSAKGQNPLSAEQLNKMYEAAGLPTPSYNPDTLTIGGAKSKQGMLKPSEGKLYARGTRINSPMNIVMRHELASKATDAKQAHLLMLSAAKKIPAGKKLPQGWVWIRDAIPDRIDAKRDIGMSQMEDGPVFREDFYRLAEHEARPKGGFALPKHVHDDIVRGRQAMSETRNAALTKGVQIWKYMVLFRPAFLMHNLLGNQAMFHLKNGWNIPAMTRARGALESGAFKEHHSAEGATFGSTEATLHGKSKAGKAASRTLNIFYELVGKHEHYLRELTMYETARKMPQVRREMRALKGGKYDPAKHEGRTMFHEAYNRAVAKNPHVRDLVTRNMDDTLGNYRYYTQQERMLKNISPFYGWERHSVRNMIRMMEDNPATMAMLTQIGMIGHDKFNRDFGPGMPDFVRSYVQDSYINTVARHLGIGDKVSMYDFNSIHPWNTAIDVGKAASGDKAAIIGMMGPLVTGPIEAYTGKNVLTAAPTKSRFEFLPAKILDQVVTSTPPVSAWDALTSKKNESKKMLPMSDKGVVAQQSGFDFRNLNKDIARKVQASKEAAAHPKPKAKKKVAFKPYANAS